MRFELFESKHGKMIAVNMSNVTSIVQTDNFDYCDIFFIDEADHITVKASWPEITAMISNPANGYK